MKQVTAEINIASLCVCVCAYKRKCVKRNIYVYKLKTNMTGNEKYLTVSRWHSLLFLTPMT